MADDESGGGGRRRMRDKVRDVLTEDGGRDGDSRHDGSPPADGPDRRDAGTAGTPTATRQAERGPGGDVGREPRDSTEPRGDGDRRDANESRDGGGRGDPGATQAAARGDGERDRRRVAGADGAGADTHREPEGDPSRKRLAEDRDSAQDGDHKSRERLIDAGKAREYDERWQVLKGDFVDEPRRAVQDANALVGDVLDDLESTFRRQREHLERQLDTSDLSTEDMRLALGRYRSFFERLLEL